jgi:tRNA pseudouridine55 synthase
MKIPPAPIPDGVLLVNKPEGCTSFSVVKKIKPWVAPLKVGHTGTLDPMATGLLPLCLGEATKLIPFLSSAPKRYLADIRLGTGTDTYDRDGQEVSRSPVPDLESALLLDCLNSFTGEIQQVPPMYSALRHRGKRMYELAREGIEVERRPRTITIERLVLTGWGPDWLELDVTCSPGTYIRSLAADIAEKLETVGHLAALTRTETDGWKVAQAHELENLRREQLSQIVIPLEAVLSRFERVDVDDVIGMRLQQGQRLSIAELRSLRVEPAKTNKIMWFRPIAGRPLILARLSPLGEDQIPKMEILRVLFPPAQ